MPGTGTWYSRASFAIAAGVGSFILLYLIQLPFTGFNILLWLSINAATALCLNSAFTNNLSGLHISVFALGLIIFLWIFGITVLSAMTATQLAAAPNVTVVSGPSDIINSSHIRLVSYETARWRSDKVIGSLGYKSEIDEPDIQTLNGTLVWITPLDYSGFLIKAWSYANEGTGGYVIVNAEDPKADARMVPVNHMVYTRYALLGNEVNRRVWEQHPEYLQMETTFQLDDRMQPKYVVNLAEPMLYGCIGERPVGVATIDPTYRGCGVLLPRRSACMDPARVERDHNRRLDWMVGPLPARLVELHIRTAWCQGSLGH